MCRFLLRVREYFCLIGEWDTVVEREEMVCFMVGHFYDC